MLKIIPECSPINYLRYGATTEQVLYVSAITNNFLNFILSWCKYVLMLINLDVVMKSWCCNEILMLQWNFDVVMKSWCCNEILML